MNTTIEKKDLLEYLALNEAKWKERKNLGQDVTHENFISDVILVYQWIIMDVEKM